MALLLNTEEDLSREVKGAQSKSRGGRERRNLECSINYGTTCASSRRGNGKAHIL
jgi:hypothetical protein